MRARAVAVGFQSLCLGLVLNCLAGPKLELMHRLQCWVKHDRICQSLI